MRLSKMHLRTLREVPKEAEIPSHILLLRTGMINKLASGVYGFMPFGWKSIRKIEQIIREEMDAIYAEEIHMSAVQPAELWKESGRWFAYGPELWRLKDRNGRDFCLGPTHEEVFTDIVRNSTSSYRQLPVHLYQIQTKYRDEARPRYGLMRSREFIMKDSYTFDRDQEGLDKNYQMVYNAYCRIFDRCCLDYRTVEADSGAIGGTNTHEFTAFAETGESEIAYCEKCSMSATVERAEWPEIPAPAGVEELALEEVFTPNSKTIEELSNFLNIKEEDTLKALLFETYDEEDKVNGYVAAFVRGNRELNMIKLINALDIPEHSIAFANEVNIGKVTGCVGGFTGPIGLKNCTIVVDTEVTKIKNLVAGANKADYHIKNVNYGRDYKGDIVTDLKTLKEGDPCPCCSEPVKHSRGIEVGQVFKLGTKYSNAMGCLYKDEDQKERPMVMGCYGIGVTRTLSAIIEQNHDEDGIIWPVNIAPYHAMVTIVDMKDEEQINVAEEVYQKLKKAGIETLLDDRNERAGIKFKDADLLGMPVRITIGKKAKDGIVEYKLRRENDMCEKTIENAISDTIKFIESEKK